MAMPASPSHTRMRGVGGNVRVPLLAVGVTAGLLLSGYQCPFHASTGWWCPGCGGTRAMLALLRGDVGAALRDNVLVLTAFPAAIAFALLAPERLQRAVARRQPLVMVLTATLTLAFTVARNSIAPGLAPL